MKKINTDALKPFDLIGGRGNAKVSRMIMAILGGSYTSHTACFIKHNTRGWGIGETSPPASEFIPYKDYEDLMNNEGYIVRVWRIKDATDQERDTLCKLWQHEIDGKPYTKKKMWRLWVFRIINTLPWHIKGHWCTRAIGHCFKAVFPVYRNPFRKPNGTLKKNETPRTAENRLVAGILEDVTDQIIIDV